MNKKLTILAAIAAFVSLQAAEQHQTGNAPIENIPLEMSYAIFKDMSVKDLSNYAATSKINGANATNFVLRKLIGNLGLPNNLLGQTIEIQKNAVDAFLRENFDVTIILNNDPEEYRLYISPFQALDIFNDDYVLTREDLKNHGLGFLFDADLLEKPENMYPHEENHPYVLKISLAKAMRYLKAIPPFTQEQIDAWENEVEAELQGRFLDELGIENEEYEHEDTFGIYWDNENEISLHNGAQRSPLKLIPRSIWLFFPQFFTCTHASLLTLPSEPDQNNILHVRSTLNVADNFISQLPRHIEIVTARPIPWIKLGNNRLTYQPVATTLLAQQINIPPSYKMSLKYITN
jgi:hypothetical protein